MNSQLFHTTVGTLEELLLKCSLMAKGSRFAVDADAEIDVEMFLITVPCVPSSLGSDG